MTTHNATEILREALDTIKATFWVSGDEFQFYTPPLEADTLNYDWDSWGTINKAILAELDTNYFDGVGYTNPKEGKAKVIGVCSIGALALANVTLYDEPLAPWERICQRDRQSWLAGAALAQTIVAETSTPEYSVLESRYTAGSIIAHWNDAEERTREQVIEMFTKALEHPLLTATEVFQLKYTVALPGQASEYSPTYNGAVYFASKEEGEAFLAGSSALRAWHNSHFDRCVFKIEPAECVPDPVSV